MKKLVVLVSLLATGFLFGNKLNIVRYESGPVFPDNREDTVIFMEDFEDGMPLNWSSEDVTDPGSYWYISNFNPFGGEGQSWRMADPYVGDNGGYLDGWYQVLDTPVVSLPSTGNSVLSFEQYRAIEEPSAYQNFDGWDGLNVRLRLADQDYDEAVILTDCNPAYNSNSLYSFGEIHGEDPDGDPGISGWAGFCDWTTTEINIPPAYNGQDVIISFAFAADNNTSTATNNDFTGIFIDEIEIAGVFYNNGETSSGFNGFTNTPIGGDLWHAYFEDNQNIIGCFDPETGHYNSNMENYLTTTAVYLPADVDNIYLDMKLQTALDDSLFPDCDYFSVEVSYLENNVWSNWNSISNPTGDPGLQNLVFTGSVSAWTMFSEGWTGYNDLTAIAGNYAKFRIGLHSNGNTPNEFGIKIDDFQIIAASNSGMSPSNLSVVLLNDYTVQLFWGMTGPAPIEYNVYRKLENDDFEYLATSSDLSFIDNDPIFNEVNKYAVTAVFDYGESDISNVQQIFVPNQTAEILQHDDNSEESGYLLANLQKAAVLFEPDYSNGNVSFTHFQLFISSITNGPLVISAWQNEAGLPGAEMSGFPISFDSDQLQPGWNTLQLPAEAVHEFSSGSFFAGYIQFVNSPQIGLDEDSFGFSFNKSNGWELISTGELMLRTIVDTDPINPTDNDPVLSTAEFQLSNYPNPFNPQTTISFNLISAQKVSLQVFNAKGQLVRTLCNGMFPAGQNEIIWNGQNDNDKSLSSGIYFYKLKTKNIEKINKMLLLK